jgi:eukaryotic-like serine/threonine-protein kinase
MAAPVRAPPPGGSPPLPQPFGRYTLLRRIAAGGMAELYLALHRKVAGFEKLVVIKRILPSMNDNPAFIDMLLHEARVAATLSHPNIVHVYDVDQVDGAYFIAMEHIHGEDLVAILGAMKDRALTRFPLEHALGIVLGMCAGLAYAHDKRDLDGARLGIVHRDISPRNIVVSFTGDVKIVDFGIAKSAVLPGEDTGAGQLKGKAPYMSPEQASGKSVDARTDIFAAGVVLFELTTGRRLFKGASEFETLKLIVDKEYPRPGELSPGYPPALERIVMRALAKRREDRYPSARDMQADLEAFVREERIAVSAVSRGRWMEQLFADKLARQTEALQDMKQLADVIAAQQEAEGDDAASTVGPTTALSTARPPARRNTAALAAGALILALVAGGVFSMRRDEPPRAPREAATNQTVADETRPGSVTVVLKIDPPPALLLDGKPWTGDRGKLEGLAPGEDHTIVASAPGCQPRTYVLRGQQGETRTITDTLTRVDAGP